MSKHKLNSNELARQIGIPATTIKRIRNNEQANPTIMTLLPIAQFFSVSLSELMGLHLSKSEVRKIPLFSWNNCIHYDTSNYETSIKNVLTERNVSTKAFALEIEDPDLVFFPKNSILIVEPEKKPETGDYVIIGNPEQNTTSIRKYIIELDQVYLKPLVTGLGVSTYSPEYKFLGVIIQYKVELKPAFK